jgi:hypothetical protein
VAEKMIAAMGAPMLINSPAPEHLVLDRHQPLPDDGKDSATLMKHAGRRDVFREGEGAQQLPVLRAEMNARARSASRSRTTCASRCAATSS